MLSRLPFVLFTLAIRNIKNMHAVSTNQIVYILHFNDKPFYNPMSITLRIFHLCMKRANIWRFDIFSISAHFLQKLNPLYFLALNHCDFHFMKFKVLKVLAWLKNARKGRRDIRNYSYNMSFSTQPQYLFSYYCSQSIGLWFYGIM